MSGSVLGIDSENVSGSAILANAQASNFLGQVPAFWGRYFYAPDQKNYLGQTVSNYSENENAFLRANNIRVMPIARQTAKVGGTAADGVTDAQTNVDAIFQAFPAQYLSGADPSVLVFLDVEGTPSLSQEYYTNWSNTLINCGLQASGGGVTFRPAIYGFVSDGPTWAALNAALSGPPATRAVCSGAWIARWYYGSPVPNGFNEALITPAGGLSCPILGWQYWASADDAEPDVNFDTDIANPAHDDVVLAGVVMPPP